MHLCMHVCVFICMNLRKYVICVDDKNYLISELSRPTYCILICRGISREEMSEDRVLQQCISFISIPSGCS